MKTLLEAAKAKIISEFRKRYLINYEAAPNDAALWDVIKDEPFTIEMHASALANNVGLIAELMLRVEKLEKRYGVRENEGVDRDSTESPVGDVGERDGVSVADRGPSEAELSSLSGDKGSGIVS